MPDYTLLHPDTDEEFVVGNASDRARLLSQGYKDKPTEQDIAAPAEVVEQTVPAPVAAPPAALGGKPKPPQKPPADNAGDKPA